MTKKLKKRIRRVGTGAVCYLAAVLLEKLIPDLNGIIRFVVFLAAYAIIGGDVVKNAVKNIGHTRLLTDGAKKTSHRNCKNE